MEEVIAEKSRNILRWLIFALIFLTICIIAVIICLVLIPDAGYMYYLLLAASAAAFVCTVYTMIKWYKTPQNIITKQGDAISFCGGVFTVGDIADIRYECRRNRWGVRASFGRLEVVLKDGRQFKNNFVGDAEEVHSKLLKFLAEYQSRKL